MDHKLAGLSDLSPIRENFKGEIILAKDNLEIEV